MNNKILALLVSAVMVMVAWVAAVSVPGAEGEGDGKETSPWMLMGNVALEYQMVPEESKNLEMDFNQIAFGAGDDDQTITIEWAFSTDVYGTDDEFTDFNLIYSDAGEPADGYVSAYPEGEGNAAISFSLEQREDADTGDAIRGVFDLTVDAAADKTMAPTYFLFRVTVLGNYGENFGEYSSYYYYGLHISVVDEKAEAAVVLSEKPDQDAVTESDVLTPYTETSIEEENYYVLNVPKDTELDKVYAYVTLLETEVFDSDDFDFYAEGLPAGIAMKVNGEITGKVAVTVSANEENEFQVFAVHKENPGEVLTATYVWKVVAGDDEFEYQIGDDVKPSSEPSYKVMNNIDDDGDEITIAWPAGDNDYTYKVYLTTEEGKTLIASGEDTSVVIGVSDEDEGVSLEGITGIVQVTIDRIPAGETEPDATAVTHILVVGPVVHSGLQPVVTAI